MFRYCDEDGNINDEANPNGATQNIAGICNIERNVFGMMPHWKRAADEELSNTDGRILFESILASLENGSLGNEIHLYQLEFSCQEIIYHNNVLI